MSTANQNNVKKSNGSTGNSVTNTPSSTPVSTVATATQNSAPPNNAPKYGTLIPNRVFVGGISANTTEAELLQLFSNYGTVKAANIIQDRAGVSRGYGFITFESEEEARQLQRDSDNIVLRERKLNIAPAIKKQPFSRPFDASSPSTIAPGAPASYFIPAGTVPFYQGGVTYYPQPAPAPGDPGAPQPSVYQPPAIYPTQTGPPQTAAYPPIVYPTQPLYMPPQQFPYQPMPYDYNYYASTNGAHQQQYLVGGQGAQLPGAGGAPGTASMQQQAAPGSPPRTPCTAAAAYGSQLPAYATDAAVYYNVPIYGPVDGPPVYQDHMDMTNGNLNAPDDEFGCGYPPLHQVVPSTASGGATVDTTRQSATPVVSLLSLDQRQEKDLIAMQGGRRQKSLEPPALANTNSNSIYARHCNSTGSSGGGGGGAAGSRASPTMNGYVTPISYAGVVNKHGEHYRNSSTVANRYSYQQEMCYGNEQRPKWYGNRRTYERRRNSEGFGNVVQNGGERRTSSPRPRASYSPNCIAANTLNFYNTLKYNNHHHHHQKVSFISATTTTTITPSSFRFSNFSRNKPNPSGRSTGRYNNNNEEYVKNSPADDTAAPSASPGPLPSLIAYSSDPQISQSSSGGGGGHNFVPPSRRNRRSVRRNPHTSVMGAAGAGLSEIGAGDAPLSAGEADATVAVKKMENLKL